MKRTETPLEGKAPKRPRVTGTGDDTIVTVVQPVTSDVGTVNTVGTTDHTVGAGVVDTVNTVNTPADIADVGESLEKFRGSWLRRCALLVVDSPEQQRATCDEIENLVRSGYEKQV
eukprot:TRINITY_DN5414_c0_g1_i1.p1 TRINITY_DN5414_c0_g1~~TRINITY_DN5414_c0_g1_i1.p1  ORF type:complete len:124 (-),score=25.77 TRINITY_DN5414_c0_g1_i1:1199-1546(-)